MSDTLKLGQIIETPQERDAIHIAIAPVIAGEGLYPNDNIGFAKGSSEIVVRKDKNNGAIGIVDPFLTENVKAGQKFWMFLYPNTITSLRHDWTHPAFQAKEDKEEIKKKVLWSLKNTEKSKQWLLDFISQTNCPDYETLISAAIDELEGDEYCSAYNDGEYLHFNGSDAHGAIPAELWDHIQKVTGKKIPQEKRAKYFSCSC